MWNEQNIRAALTRSSLLIAYLALVVGAVIAFTWIQGVTDRLELESQARAFQNCASINETRAVMGDVLDEILLVARDGDTPEERGERAEARERVEPLIQPLPCPPDPEKVIVDQVRNGE